ncbi:hypothetical protein CRENBAI_023273 [Crenichthys baileyi]|uniref:Mannosyltransferase n=1 Tax=Crenichthys baileyi TaxID=28760 RepID=A0AAV9QXP4_9TELE
MTSFLYPGQRYKLRLQILLPLSALTALTQFLSPDHLNLLSHRVYYPENLWRAFQLLPHLHSEEPEFSFLIPLRILRSLVAFSLSFTLLSVLCSATNLPLCLQRFLSLQLVVSCLMTSRAFNIFFESYLLYLAEISGSQSNPLHFYGLYNESFL